MIEVTKTYTDLIGLINTNSIPYESEQLNNLCYIYAFKDDHVIWETKLDPEGAEWADYVANYQSGEGVRDFKSYASKIDTSSATQDAWNWYHITLPDDSGTHVTANIYSGVLKIKNPQDGHIIAVRVTDNYNALGHGLGFVVREFIYEELMDTDITLRFDPSDTGSLRKKNYKKIPSFLDLELGYYPTTVTNSDFIIVRRVYEY